MLGSIELENFNFPLLIALSLVAILAVILAAVLTSSRFTKLREHWLDVYRRIKDEERRNLAHNAPGSYAIAIGAPNPGPQADA